MKTRKEGGEIMRVWVRRKVWHSYQYGLQFVYIYNK